MTDCVQFMSGKSERWGMVQDFLEDRNSQLNIEGARTDPNWNHSAILTPRAYVSLLDGWDGLDNLCDSLGLSGRQRIEILRHEKLKQATLRVSRLYAACQEFSVTRELPSDLSDYELKKCMEILGDSAKSPKDKLNSMAHTKANTNPSIKRVTRANTCPKQEPVQASVKPTKELEIMCPVCGVRDSMPRDYRDPANAVSVKCPCLKCQKPGMSCIWFDRCGKEITSTVLR